MSPLLTLDLIGMVTLMILGVPVTFAILGAALVYYMLHPDTSTLVMMQQIQTALRSFPLLAIPFFILAGTTMAQGGIAERIVSFADALVGHWRGGLAQVGVLNSLIMGSMTGSAIADAAVDSKVLVPEMRKHGYSLSFASVISAASSIIAPVLPPSTSMIIFGLLGSVSVAKLFMGGVIPAFMIAIVLMATVAVISYMRGYVPVRAKRLPASEIAKSFKRCFWALMMPVLLLLGLRAGIFTITELAAMAALYTLIVSGLIYRTIGLRDVGILFKETARTTSAVLIIIGASSAFSYIFAIEQVPVHVIELLSSISNNPIVIMLCLNVALLLMGMIVEGAAIMILAAPILVGIANHFGIDPVHMGVMVVVNLTIGTLTPPVGAVLYTVCAITGCRTGDFIRELLPFLGALLVVLLAITFYSPLILALPNWMYQ
jgi:tripartite ATP-independent transporter DctM subunit